MDQLVALRLFERVVLRIAKISAGILHLIVEEQAIELGRNVVMVAGMSSGKPDRIGLMPAPQAAPHPPHQLLRAVRIKPGAVDREQQQKVMDCGAVLQRQRAVHIGFGGVQFRIDEQSGVELAVVQVDGDVRPGQPIAEDMHFAVGVANPQGALADETPKQIGQQTHVADPRARYRIGEDQVGGIARWYAMEDALFGDNNGENK